jgi:hypothetical protein
MDDVGNKEEGEILEEKESRGSVRPEEVKGNHLPHFLILKQDFPS